MYYALVNVIMEYIWHNSLCVCVFHVHTYTYMLSHVFCKLKVWSIATSILAHHSRIVSSLDQIAGLLGPGIPVGGTLRPRESSFEMEISRVDVSAVPNSGYAIRFIQNSVDEALLPASLFSSRGGNVLLSSSLISETSVFRGKNRTVSFTSKVFSISVVGETNTILDDPVTVTFENTAANVSFCIHTYIGYVRT